MKICIAQTRPERGNIEGNILNHKKWIDIAVSEKADLIVFPELSLTGYECKLAKELAANQNDPGLNDFQQISNSNKIVIGVGLPTRSEEGILISMVLFQPDQPRCTYSKQQLHSDERPYFIHGDKQLILTVKNTKIAPAICYEALQADHLENAVELGAELYLASVAKPQNGVEKAFAHFPEIAAKYSMPVLMANCTGYCDTFESAGQTSVWDEKGNLMGRLNSTNEGILIYDTETKELVKRANVV